MEKYDVIVVGGGLGGMTAANYLASRGKRTLVLEQNHQTGGNLSGFRRKGFYFDGGDQSFESLGIMFPVLEELGLLDRVSWRRARFRMVSPDFDFYIDSFDTVEEALRSAFPAETGIPVLFREIREVSRFLERHYDPWTFPLLHDFSFARLFRVLPWMLKLRKWLTYEYRVRACSVIRDPVLRSWFSEIGYRRMPYIFFAGFWHLWMKDYWYPAGGMQALNDVLAERFTGLGGELRLGTRVARIERRGGRAASVVTEKGETFTADSFVYAGDYKRLVGDIMPAGVFKPAFAEKVRKAELTEELLNVYLGVDYPPEELSSRLGAQHTFYFPNYRVVFPRASSPRDVHRGMWILINHFGAENPGGAPPGNSTLVLQTYSSRDWENRWRSGESGDGGLPRTEAYRALKREVAAELTGLAENVLPGLGSRVLYSDAGTPLTGERFTLNTRGSSGGWCYDDRESLVYRFPALNLFRTPLSNLRVCGHYSLWPGGVISAALSGKIVGNITAGRRPLEKL